MIIAVFFHDRPDGALDDDALLHRGGRAIHGLPRRHTRDDSRSGHRRRTQTVRRADRLGRRRHRDQATVHCLHVFDGGLLREGAHLVATLADGVHHHA
jgi:hypothetical protein